MPTSRRLLLGAVTALPLLLGGGVALAQDRIEPDPTLRLPRPSQAGLSTEDQAFVSQAIAAANAAIKAGTAAERQAQDDAVRRLAHDIATDQQSIKTELTRLAPGKEAQPGNPAPKEVATLSALAGESGPDWDKRYLAAQYQASRWLFAAYQNEMAATQTLDLRTFTAAHELTLRKHLDAIEKVASTLGLRLEAPRNPPQY